MHKSLVPAAGETFDVTAVARATAAFLAVFDTALGGVAVARPDLLERFLGVKQGTGGRGMLRRTGVIWSAYAAANAVAAARGKKRDWQVLAWMRAMEIPADPLWEVTSRSRIAPRGRAMLWLTPVCNFLFTAIFAGAAARAEE